MRDIQDAAAMAQILRGTLAATGYHIPLFQAQELVARQFGLNGWPDVEARMAPEPVALRAAVPVLRVDDEAQARAFYIGFLGFRMDWDHRAQEGAPLYAQISRSGCRLHLSGDAGSARMGSTSFVPIDDAAAFQAELVTRNSTGAPPALEERPWGLQVMVSDPFGNRLRFCELRERD